VKVVTDLDCIRAAVLVPEIPAVWGIEARMGNRELQETTGSQHPIGFSKHTPGFRDVHKTHESGGKIKGSLSKRQIHCTGDAIIDAQRFVFFRLLCVVNKNLRDVDSRHSSATFGQQPGIMTFATPDVQPCKPIHIRQYGKESRCIEVVPIDVVAGSGEFRPGIGIGIPKTAYFFVIHPLFIPLLPGNLVR
jgi:hypothetical protein